MPWRHSFVRFLASGAFNTLATYVAYIGLLNVFSYRWSYTISYFAGIALAYVLSRYVVFKQSGGRYGVVWLVLIYGLQYAAGIGLVQLWVEVFGALPVFAPAFAIAISMP
ncbi:MAG: GtrA family protein, partial [Comamonadaceae bacterium]